MNDRTKRTRRWLRRLVRLVPTDLLTSWVIRALARTLRITKRDDAGLLSGQFQHKYPGPVLFAFWHNRIAMMPWVYQHYLPNRKVMVMISVSRDGQWIANTARRFGIDAARGSSSKAGVQALIRMGRETKRRGTDLAITPDGPRGPRYQVQPGLFLLAKRYKLPVLPVTIHYQSKWEISSWDRFQIPKPFTRAQLVFDTPILPPDADSPDAIDDWKKRIERSLGK